MPACQVLVADGDSAIREALQLALESEGCKVLLAPDGRTVLELLHRQSQQLVCLIAWRLPDIDGAALLALAARDPHLAQRHRFIFMITTPSSLTTQARQQLEALAVPLLPKPFDLEQLFMLVAQAARSL